MTSSNPPTPAPCYGDEDSSDVIFFVGNEDQGWRLPAHRAFLAQRNPVFGAMFSRNFISHFDRDGRLIVQIKTPEPRCFDNFLRFLYDLPMPLQSLETAMATFQTGDQYICPELCELCVSDITDKVNSSNAVNVYKFVHFYYQRLVSVEISFLRHELANGTVDIKTSKLYSLMNHLYNKCLTLIDQDTTSILSSDQIEELSLPQLATLLSRSSLQVPNEIFVFSILQRWAEQECKRLRMPLTSENKRLVLGDTLYVVRFFLMSPEDFECGPAASGLLPDDFVAAYRLVQTLLPAKTCFEEPSSESLQWSLNDVLLESIQAHFPDASRAFIFTMFSPRTPMLKNFLPAMNIPSNQNSKRVKLALKKVHHLILEHHSGIQATKSLMRLVKNRTSFKRSQLADMRILKLRMLRYRLRIFVQRIWVLWAFFFD